MASRAHPRAESALVKATAIHFTRGSIDLYKKIAQSFVDALNKHNEDGAVDFRAQGLEFAIILCAAVLDFGDPESLLWNAFTADDNQAKKSAGDFC